MGIIKAMQGVVSIKWDDVFRGLSTWGPSINGSCDHLGWSGWLWGLWATPGCTSLNTHDEIIGHLAPSPQMPHMPRAIPSIQSWRCELPFRHLWLKTWISWCPPMLWAWILQSGQRRDKTWFPGAQVQQLPHWLVPGGCLPEGIMASTLVKGLAEGGRVESQDYWWAMYWAHSAPPEPQSQCHSLQMGVWGMLRVCPQVIYGDRPPLSPQEDGVKSCLWQPRRKKRTLHQSKGWQLWLLTWATSFAPSLAFENCGQVVCFDI